MWQNLSALVRVSSSRWHRAHQTAPLTKATMQSLMRGQSSLVDVPDGGLQPQQLSPEDVIGSRSGDVLIKHTVLKADHFPSVAPGCPLRGWRWARSRGSTVRQRSERVAALISPASRPQSRPSRSRPPPGSGFAAQAATTPS